MAEFGVRDEAPGKATKALKAAGASGRRCHAGDVPAPVEAGGIMPQQGAPMSSKPNSFKALAEMAKKRKDVAPISQAPISQAPSSPASVSHAPASSPVSAPAAPKSVPPPLPVAPVSAPVSVMPDSLRTVPPIAADTTPLPAPSNTTTPPTKADGRGRGLLVAGVLALVGLGGVAAVTLRGANDDSAATASAATVDATPEAVDNDVEADSEDSEALPVREVSRGGVDLDALPEAADDDSSDEDATADPDAAAAFKAAVTNAKDESDEKAEADTDTKKSMPKSDGTLAEEMADAVGADGNASDDKTEKTVSSAKPTGPIPKRPPQGAVLAALRQARAAAKGCIAGADEKSIATVTFSSSGAASGVSVGGWAAANGQTSCVKSALMTANVGPFQDASYSASVSIRP